MKDAGLPDAIRHFISTHVKSVASLETLLLLRSYPGKSWTSDELAQEMRTNPFHAGTLLDELISCNLVILQKINDKNIYTLKTDDAVMNSLLEQLADVYKQRRLHLINEIYLQPVDKLRTLADSFKIRKD